MTVLPIDFAQSQRAVIPWTTFVLFVAILVCGCSFKPGPQKVVSDYLDFRQRARIQLQPLPVAPYLRFEVQPQLQKEFARYFGSEDEELQQNQAIGRLVIPLRSFVIEDVKEISPGDFEVRVKEETYDADEFIQHLGASNYEVLRIKGKVYSSNDLESLRVDEQLRIAAGALRSRWDSNHAAAKETAAVITDQLSYHVLKRGDQFILKLQDTKSALNEKSRTEQVTKIQARLKQLQVLSPELNRYSGSDKVFIKGYVRNASAQPFDSGPLDLVFEFLDASGSPSGNCVAYIGSSSIAPNFTNDFICLAEPAQTLRWDGKHYRYRLGSEMYKTWSAWESQEN